MLRIQEVHDVRKLQNMLEKEMHREHKLWAPCLINLEDSEDKYITMDDRDEAVMWLFEKNTVFEFHPETLVHSINYLDRFLSVMKVHPKYMVCITVACLYLGSKMVEEDEDVPLTGDLIRVSKCGCSVSEVLRMERTILDKLNWDMHVPTSLGFLQILHARLLAHHPQLLNGLGHMTASRHLSILTTRLLTSLSNGVLSQYSGSTIAVSLLSLELERLTPAWLSIIIMMQDTVKVENQDLIHCREVISQTLMGYPTTNALYYCINPPSVIDKSDHQLNKVSTDLDEIFDSIKLLYEDGWEKNQPVVLEKQCKGSSLSPCPLLQTVGPV
ncbi:cyclin-I-like [Anneissia japonica]|uniref:cyclin-I-like n=1 Tax=Anneissia japonica TaxID=1529436 RepID=UPI001425A8D4|nr:cyclin-I-like [Anneissia japonica]